MSASLLNNLSSYSTTIIAVAAGLHLLGFFGLWTWYRQELRSIASALDSFTRELHHRSILDTGGHLSDQVHAFLIDVNEILDNPARKVEQQHLLTRIKILDERRTYLQSMWFETMFNVSRTMIEAYPLAGVLGTILAIGVVLQTGTGVDPTVGAIVGRFGEAIWSTFAGLMASIVLMFINSLVEPPFTRLTENRQMVRETIARARRMLALTPGGSK